MTSTYPDTVARTTLSAAAEREWTIAAALCAMFWALNRCAGAEPRYTVNAGFMIQLDDEYLRETVRDVMRLTRGD